LIFSTASADFNVDPLTYKRKTYFAWRELEPGCVNSPANPGFRFPAGLLFFGRFFMRARVFVLVVGIQRFRAAFARPSFL
jgi:hypothetical protein